MNRIFIVIAMALFGIAACRSGEDLTIVEIECDECKGKTVKISSFDLLEPKNIEIAKGRFDSNGRANLQFDIKEDRFLTLGIDTSDYYMVYLFANEKVEIECSGKLLKFKGDNGHFYQNLESFKQISDSLHVVGNLRRAGPDRVEDDQKEALLRELRLPVRRYESRIEADDSLTPRHKGILLTYARYFSDWLDKSFRYGSDDATYAYWQKNGNEANGYAPDFFKTLTVSTEAVFATCYSYIGLIDFELQQNLWRPIEFHLDESDEDYDHGTIGLRCAGVINKAGFPKSFSELLLAKNLDLCLRLGATTPSVEELYNQFKMRYPKSSFQPTLKRRFDESKALAAGQPAKDFYAFREDGKRFQLSELKGKVVYVDFWATWCGPCVEELPHSKKLIKRFAGDDGIVFLFVSLDQNEKKWKDFLRKEKYGNSLHVRVDEPGLAVTGAYRTAGIPHYLLIDDLGNIYSADAPRPSFQETAGVLTEMLATRASRK